MNVPFIGRLLLCVLVFGFASRSTVEAATNCTAPTTGGGRIRVRERTGDCVIYRDDCSTNCHKEGDVAYGSGGTVTLTSTHTDTSDCTCAVVTATFPDACDATRVEGSASFIDFAITKSASDSVLLSFNDGTCNTQYTVVSGSVLTAEGSDRFNPTASPTQTPTVAPTTLAPTGSPTAHPTTTLPPTATLTASSTASPTGAPTASTTADYDYDSDEFPLRHLHKRIREIKNETKEVSKSYSDRKVDTFRHHHAHDERPHQH
mmetsp:Transcript_35170/g.76864  ORF Transcript_35170/g.76864 Transcript_35170/m.76864 type:complete len:261 (-) Transcript_35170:3691-4473(-)